MQLRSFQQSGFDQIQATDLDAVFQLDTGAGKTPVITTLAQHKPTVLIAHRNMLIEQISQTLTKMSVNHQIIGNSQITKRCQLYQRNHAVEYSGTVYVATIQSLISWYKRGKLKLDLDSILQIIIDECHHVANGNMWASVKDIFTNARFIGVTATPCRLDGQGLHKDCGGLFDVLIQAEELKDNSTQWLIANSYLSDYEAWHPPTSITLKDVCARTGREYDLDELGLAVSSKEIVGEVVAHHQRLARELTTIVFCPTVLNAELVCAEFIKNGYTATYIASTLSFVENMRRLDAFRNGQVQVLINVEMATEGLDVPAAACLIMLRLTASFTFYKQMIGRVLRPKDSKAVIIDHVGNIVKHGMPDDQIEWTLHGTPKNKSEHNINCEECGFIHNIYLASCPECGKENWLRNSDETDPNHLVLANVIDIELVRKMRNHFDQQKITEQKVKAKAEYELKLASELITPKFYYGTNTVGLICNKLSFWFVAQLKDADIPIREINSFLLGIEPPITFWTYNFTVTDLQTKNPKKCKKVFEKWQSSL